MADARPPMSSPCQPATLAELAEAVRSAPRVIAVGAGTKPRLAQIAGSCTRISTAKLTGFIEYEPSEFTFTALAGTPVREIAAVLAERGQYLPFDPMLGEAGATLGGTVAAGVNGPGRWRYGGLRDFILGVRFVDGAGRVLRMGGKVVKNAAGFDLPKFFVGSAGRFGVLGEISFKVFPRPAATRTLRLRAADDAARVQILTAGAAARWELDAIDAALDEPAVYARLAGPEPALGGLAAEILGRFPGEELPPDEARERWRAVGEFAWAPPGGSLVKLVITPLQLPEVAAWVRVQERARAWCSAGGNVVYVARPAGAAWPASPWPGLRLRGDGELWLGPRRSYAVQEAVKATLDPEKRFPGLEE